jgi:hypothetical protein
MFAVIDHPRSGIAGFLVVGPRNTIAPKKQATGLHLPPPWLT